MRQARELRTWVYTRVAGPDSSALEAQEEKLRRFAAERAYAVAGLTAEHDSGATMDRQWNSEVSAAVRRGAVDVLLVANLDRLGRRSAEVFDYIGWLERQGVSVVAADGTDVRKIMELAGAVAGLAG